MNMSEQGENKLSRSSLIGLVIGSMIGGGAFNLMSDMGGQAGGLAIIIGWVISCIFNTSDADHDCFALDIGLSRISKKK